MACSPALDQRRATSTITSPTTSTLPATDSARRFSAAASEEHSSSSEAWSVSTRLSSSGIERSNERMPASMWITGIACLGGGEGARERRVRVAVDEGRVRGDLVEQGLERGEHAGGLGGVAAAGDPELAVGPCEAELGEEDRRERVVVVLAGVHEDLLVLLAQRARRPLRP